MIAENFLGARRVDHPRSVLPKPLKSIRRQGGVARGVLDVAVSQIGLQRAGIVAVVRELVATGVSKHMGMGFDAKIGRRRSPLDLPPSCPLYPQKRTSIKPAGSPLYPRKADIRWRELDARKWAFFCGDSIFRTDVLRCLRT
jgi:hypothetical protein